MGMSDQLFKTGGNLYEVFSYRNTIIYENQFGKVYLHFDTSIDSPINHFVNRINEKKILSISIYQIEKYQHIREGMVKNCC